MTIFRKGDKVKCIIKSPVGIYSEFLKENKRKKGIWEIYDNMYANLENNDGNWCRLKSDIPSQEYWYHENDDTCNVIPFIGDIFPDKLFKV